MTRELLPNQDETPGEPTLDSAPEEITQDPQIDEDHLRVEEAAALVGVSAAEFEALAKRAGIGRHYDPRETGQFVYARSDVEQAKGLKDGS